MKLTTPTLKALLSNNIPALLTGAPGIGKTALVNAAAAELGWPLIDIHLLTRDPLDIRGVPFVEAGADMAKVLPFEEMHTILHAEVPTVVFFDDVGQASVALQSPVMRLIHERLADGKPISPHIRFIAATNRREDKAGVNGIITPLLSRFVVVDVEPDTQATLDWATQTDAFHPAVLSYLSYRPGNMLAETKAMVQQAAALNNTPSPRTWELASRVLKADPPSEALAPLLAGCVGDGVAAELIGHLRIHANLISADEVFSNPMGAKLPDDSQPAISYALVVALSLAVTGETSQAYGDYLSRMLPEYQTLGWRMARNRFLDTKDPSNFSEVRIWPAFAKWVTGPVGKAVFNF